MIESKDNRLIKKIRLLAAKKNRDKLGLFVIEGEKFVDSLPGDYYVEEFIFSESFFAKRDVQRYEKRAPMYIAADSIFNSLSDTVTPQGILAVCRKKAASLESLPESASFFLLGENIQDPGNLGTLIRTADAAGADAVILSKGSADIYNPKVIRGTAGSIFHIPIVQDSELTEAVLKLKQKGVSTAAAHLKGQKLPYETDFTKKTAILIGNEGKGLTDQLTSQADALIKIPMQGKAESLNASIASGILLYEVVRQRLAAGL